ncbi:MAG: cobalamin-dependent protein [Planctomycetota bacterium]
MSDDLIPGLIPGLILDLADLVERGKADRDSPHPPDLRGRDGAAEVARRALDAGLPPDRILREGLVVGMQRVGDRFGKGEAFIPEILISARAMQAAMVHLEPLFASGAVERRGTIIIGTVAGDLHDIGKNIVRMVLEGDGWKVVDLGVDVGEEQFAEAVLAEPVDAVGLSALLTTTMVHMGGIVDRLADVAPDVRVYVGGAPVTAEFAEKIDAHGWFPDPFTFSRHLAETA